MSVSVTPTKLDILPPKHGGDLAYWQRKLGREADTWLDLSSACNREPWPIPNVPNDLWMALPDQTELLNEAETYYGHRPAAIGAGSQHIIEVLPPLLRENASHKSNRVFVPRVGYQEHAFAWEKWGFELAYYDSVEELIGQEWTVAVVIQPNNPTAEWTSLDVLAGLIEYAQSHSANVVIDEAFIDTANEKSVLSTFEHHNWGCSLLVLRSVGKFFGLAGARVGFVFCDDRWASSLKNLLGPWPVSTASLHVVRLALSDKVWQANALMSLRQRQSVFIEQIVPKLNTIFDSQDRCINDLFFTWRLDSQEYAEQVFSMLHQVGIHTRLGDGWIRVALPAETEMDILNRALIRLLKGEGGRELG